jgi:hypothetical protein
MRFADLDAVTVDGYGTLVQLRDPVPLFLEQLDGRGVESTPDTVAAGFAAEVAYYRPNALLGSNARGSSSRASARTWSLRRSSTPSWRRS